ncbi:type 4 pilus major pilin [Stenotrophomonas bentonitica]
MKEKNRGFGLNELLISIGLVSALGAAAFMIYFPAKARAQVKAETGRNTELVSAIRSSFGVVGTYEGVSAERLIEDQLVNPSAVQGAAKLGNAWGGNTYIQALGIVRFGDSFSVEYTKVSADSCGSFVTANAVDVQDIVIDGRSVYQNSGGQLDVAAMTLACSAPKSVTFVYFSPELRGLVAADPLLLPQAPTPPIVRPPTAPGLPAFPEIDPGRSAEPALPVNPACGPRPAIPACPGINNYSWSSTAYPSCWRLNGSCQIPPAPEPSPVVWEPQLPDTITPPTIPPRAICQRASESSEIACPVGHWGRGQVRREKLCLDAWDDTWEAPITSYAGCTACPANRTEEQFQTVPRTEACSGGRTGTVNIQIRQRGTRSVSYNCPLGQTTEPAPNFGSWSWQDTGEVVSKDESGCVSPGVVVNANSKFYLSNTNDTRLVPAGMVLAETTTWTSLGSVSGEWPSSQGPIRAWTDVSFTYNGVVNGLYASADTTSPQPSSPINRSQIYIRDFGGKVIEFDVRTTSSHNNSSINGRLAIYYRMK